MTNQEYAQRDMELLDSILFYQSDNAEHETQISVNNMRIMELEKQRLSLRREYENPAPQRNLQGEIIEKEVA